jgi:hypothetical protein
VKSNPTRDAGLNQLELDILDRLLAGPDRSRGELREQLPYLTGVLREYTGHGFFTDLEYSEAAPHATVSDYQVHGGASVSSLKHGVGFVLFVRGGLLVQIEGFAYDEPWPDDIGKYDIFGLLID